jgi:hypothetical protein
VVCARVCTCAHADFGTADGRLFFDDGDSLVDATSYGYVTHQFAFVQSASESAFVINRTRRYGDVSTLSMPPFEGVEVRTHSRAHTHAHTDIGCNTRTTMAHGDSERAAGRCRLPILEAHQQCACRATGQATAAHYGRTSVHYFLEEYVNTISESR